MVSIKIAVCFVVVCIALASAGPPCHCRKSCRHDERPTSPCFAPGTHLCCPRKLGIGVLTGSWGYDYRHRYPFVTRTHYPRMSRTGGGGGFGAGGGFVVGGGFEGGPGDEFDPKIYG